MSGGVSIHGMSDRELRAAKRALRQRRERRRKFFVSALTMLAVACFIIGASFCASSIKSNAKSGFKYYTGVIVESGDTLWSLADEYIDYSHYEDKGRYIAEVRNINHLDDDCSIMTGQMLIVPYYSDEYRK